MHAWLRSGNTGAGQGAAQFLSEALSLLGGKHRVRCVRADSGFYADSFLSFLEARALPYIVVARLTTYLKGRLYQLIEWQELDGIYSVSEFGFKLGVSLVIALGHAGIAEQQPATGFHKRRILFDILAIRAQKVSRNRRPVSQLFDGCNQRRKCK